MGCQSPTQKVENAEQDVVDAQANLKQAQLDSAAVYEKVRADWAVQIADNEKTLADYKVKIAKERKVQREKDEARLDELEKRNETLKAQMQEFKQDGKDNWETFKTNFKKAADEFGEDMKRLGNSIVDIGRKDNK